MNKKISIGLTIAIAALAAVIAFFAASSIVQNKMNETVTDLNEKQNMYSKLSELDNCVRTNKGSEEIDEAALMEGICRGYIEGLGESKFTYMSAEEYSEYSSSNSAESDTVTVIKLSDGSAVIIEEVPDTSATQ